MSEIVLDLDKATIQNENFREVIYGGIGASKLQLVLMSLLPDEEIGMEVHRVDQFFRVEQGEGLAIIRGKRYHIKDGTGLVVPAGTYHNIINISKYKELKLYTIYCPPEHPVGERELYKS